MKGIDIAEVLDLICALVFFSSEEDALHLLGFEQLQITSELIGFDYSAVGQRYSSRQAESKMPSLDSPREREVSYWLTSISYSSFSVVMLSLKYSGKMLMRRKQSK